MKKEFKYIGINYIGRTTRINKDDELYASLKKGQTVWLDKDLANSSKVEVISQTPKRMFTTVTSNEGQDTWSVMTCRLTVL